MTAAISPVAAADFLSQPVITLKGVGSKVADKLARLHLHTLRDLLLHLPLRYEDRTRIQPLHQLLPGAPALVKVEVLHAEVVRGRRRQLVVRTADASGTLDLRFFHFTAAQVQRFARGQWLLCYGDVTRGPYGLSMSHPETRTVSAELSQADLTDSLTPVYPLTEGLSQQQLRKLIGQLLTQLPPVALPELLPAEFVASQRWPALQDAVRMLHQPSADVDVSALLQGSHPACQRLAFEELLTHQLTMGSVKAASQQEKAWSLRCEQALRRAFLQQLPFSATRAQQRVSEEIEADLLRPHPMMRLVQGDVGSGKTLVAALAALQAIECGKQVALMAPTEILAEQHFTNFSRWLEPLGIQVGFLASKLTAANKRRVQGELAEGSIQLMVGTHALFQQSVEFKALALVIIDEQHRFGVHQRLALRDKGVLEGAHRIAPHQLVMTATPIPRTLAMTAYADLDVSIIDELPPGRTPVTTVVIPDTRREQVIERIAQACRQGRQAYWVCTLIEDSEVLQCQAAESTAALLAEQLPEISVGLVHGRLKPTEKQQVMDRFAAGELDLLVATTVIEVGVDVPNASLMVIENPERLGLAQLHQLRGRVGRGQTASHCVLLYQAPLSLQGKARLGVMRDSNDGFVIAEKDLELRGPGEILGSRQTGVQQFKIADLQRDQALLELAVEVSRKQRFPQSTLKALQQRWLINAEQYSRA